MVAVLDAQFLQISCMDHLMRTSRFIEYTYDFLAGLPLRLSYFLWCCESGSKELGVYLSWRALQEPIEICTVLEFTHMLRHGNPAGF